MRIGKKLKNPIGLLDLVSNSHLLKVAQIGCGAFSELNYIPVLRGLEKFDLLQVQALYDPNPGRVAQLQNSFSSATQATDIANLPKLDVNLAILASFPRFHTEETIKILKSKISVLCEKPMATGGEKGQEMIETALKQNEYLR
jgi:predicted dehydrogenase